MSNITICSKTYEQQLVDFYYWDIKELVIKEGRNDNIFYFTTKKENIDIDLLAQLLEDIILDGDPVTSKSYKLYNVMKIMIFAEEHENIKKQLDYYFKYNRTINLEGYINFRMYSYKYKISEVLYSVVKKSLCLE